MTKEEVEKLINWYSYYHKLASCYKWKYKKLKRIRLLLNVSSVSLTVIGEILAPTTHYTSLSISGVGVIIQGYVTKSNINRKMESCKFANQNYKILIQFKTPYENVL